jgi:acetyl esterase/lipase
LGVNPEKIAVGGTSAGGCLAVGMALMARDRQGPRLAFQLLLYPCLDNRHNTPSSHAVTDGRTWNRQTSLRAWQAYLGDDPEGPPSSYAAPLRSPDLSGLPSTYILAAELDLLRDENIAYATRLMQAGVTTELHVLPGTFHGFDGSVPDAAVSRRARAEYTAALKRELGG